MAVYRVFPWLNTDCGSSTKYEEVTYFLDTNLRGPQGLRAYLAGLLQKSDPRSQQSYEINVSPHAANVRVRYRLLRSYYEHTSVPKVTRLKRDK